ncbi:hypothetical protein [Rathayibacter sp. VKM Ac-2857]|uniref:hypothetical protein n=1 Tax=Rathayibacter sp. VKM Ac-2857 TaxID=2739020 RepID=UPI001567117F|nr:hypothetical protein [Rathayibacter sp. VKM Ac-2857]NQX17641.1 hypothetical protein [Rathayibacter sp. VKM Ac-2857]
MARTAVSAARQLFSRSRRSDSPGEGEPPYGVEPDVTEYLPPARAEEAPPAGAALGQHAPPAHAAAEHVFDVPAPAIGEYCELDADALEFPHPGVASFVPDLSRPARGGGSHSAFRSPPPPPAPAPAAPSPMIDLPRDFAPSEEIAEPPADEVAPPAPPSRFEPQPVDAQFFDGPPAPPAPPVWPAPPVVAPPLAEQPVELPSEESEPAESEPEESEPEDSEPAALEFDGTRLAAPRPPAAPPAAPPVEPQPAEPQPVDALFFEPPTSAPSAVQPPPPVAVAPPLPPAPTVDAALLRGFALVPTDAIGPAPAPVIGEVCELDTEHLEFPHPNAAAFVPVQGRSRGGFGLLLPEPVRRSAPTEPEQYAEQYAEPQQYADPQQYAEPQHVGEPAHVTEPEQHAEPQHRTADPAQDLFDERFLAPAPFPGRGDSDDDPRDDDPAFLAPPVPATAHQWHGTPVSADPAGDEGRPRSRRAGVLIGAGIGAAVLLIGGALVAVPLITNGGGDGATGPVAASDPGTTEAAVTWVADTIDPASVLLVQDDLVGDVTDAGFPGDTVVSESTLSAAAPDTAWRAADYILATPGLRATATGETETALDNSEAVASFGSGDTAVEVRRVLDQGTDQAAAAATVLTAARASAGGQLAANPALTTTDAARALLEGGRVDSRLLLMLGQQLAFTPLSVADFPVGANEVDGVRHRMLLTGYNGAALPADAAAVQNATTWLGSQTGDFVPTSVESTPEGLLVALDLDEPTGLLPGAQ